PNTQSRPVSGRNRVHDALCTVALWVVAAGLFEEAVVIGRSLFSHAPQISTRKIQTDFYFRAANRPGNSPQLSSGPQFRLFGNSSSKDPLFSIFVPCDRRVLAADVPRPRPWMMGATSHALPLRSP